MESLETDRSFSGPLKPVLAERLPWLFEDLGFQITYSDYSPAQFGDSTVILDSDSLRLRFVRDRSQVMLHLAARSEPEEWFGLHSLYEVIHNESIKPRYTLNAIGDLLKQEFPALVEALGAKLFETQKKVEQRRNERLKTLGIRPKPGTHI
jgi:hypothetical protein